MRTAKALAKREDLAQEVRSAKEAVKAGQARLKDLRKAEKALGKRRTLALKEQARTGKTAALEKIDTEQADLNQQLERESIAADAAREARDEAQREFEQLHRTELEALAEHAESLTTTAMEKLAALEEPYAEAYAAWVKARREWNKLASFNEELDPAPHPPLPEASQVFTAAPPHCQGIEVEGGIGPVSSGPAKPEPGTPRTWEHRVDLRTHSTRAGEEQDRVFEADSDWIEVEKEEEVVS